MPFTGYPMMEPPAQGLLVGRLERRAWFDDVKGDGDFNHYELHVGLEPDRVDAADLEVELEEWADGGELTNVRRLLLGELDLGARAGEDRLRFGSSAKRKSLAWQWRGARASRPLIAVTPPEPNRRCRQCRDAQSRMCGVG